MKMFLALALLVSLQAHAITGHDQGGGGGGFCIADKCKTLAEAGFRLQEDTQQASPPVITKSVVDALKNILGKTVIDKDFYNILYKLSLPPVWSLIKLEIADGDLFEKSKKEYIDLLKQQGFPTNNFELFAFTNKTEGNTYLLPSFAKLNDMAKAKILIHEGVVRQTGNIKTALKMDAAIERTLNGQSDAASLLIVYAKEIGYDFQNSYVSAIMASYVSDYLHNTKHSLRATDSFSGSSISLNESDDAADLYSMGDIFWQVLHQARVVSMVIGDRNGHDLLLSYHPEVVPQIEQICSADGKTDQSLFLFQFESSVYVLTCSKGKAVDDYSMPLVDFRIEARRPNEK
jgi:hypothetical protein